jgi:hypothetical protein
VTIIFSESINNADYIATNLLVGNMWPFGIWL